MVAHNLTQCMQCTRPKQNVCVKFFVTHPSHAEQSPALHILSALCKDFMQPTHHTSIATLQAVCLHHAHRKLVLNYPQAFCLHCMRYMRLRVIHALHFSGKHAFVVAVGLHW